MPSYYCCYCVHADSTVTVNFVAELDWGPVVGGYVATLFLAAGYLAVGLYVSSRSESQIESLILSSLICGFSA